VISQEGNDLTLSLFSKETSLSLALSFRRRGNPSHPDPLVRRAGLNKINWAGKPRPYN